MTQRIKKWRLDKGFTQQQVADLLGYSMQQVWRWENRKSKMPPLVIMLIRLYDKDRAAFDEMVKGLKLEKSKLSEKQLELF